MNNQNLEFEKLVGFVMVGSVAVVQSRGDFMTKDIVAEMQPFLGPGETLLWAGRPKGGVIFRGSDVFVIPFSLCWGGFAVFWEVMALTALAKSDGPMMFKILFPLFGLPFVMVGLYLIFGRFYFDKLRRERTAYAVTNERLVVKAGIFSQTITSTALSSAGALNLVEKADGTGTIMFGPEYPFRNHMADMQNITPTMAGAMALRFELIPAARQVYELIRKAAADAEGKKYVG